MGQNLDVSLLYEGHSDLGFVGLRAQLWETFSSDTVEDITFLTASNNHMVDEVSTFFFRGNRVRFEVSPDVSFNKVALWVLLSFGIHFFFQAQLMT